MKCPELVWFAWMASIAVLYGLLGILSSAAVAEMGAGQHSHGEPSAEGSRGVKSQPDEPMLSLQQLEQMALKWNPTLAQAAAQVRVAAGRKLQAGLYPNPVVGYDSDEISTPASGGEHGGFVEQTIVTAGKLGLSREIFEQEQGQAEEQTRAQRYRVLNTVRRRYYETLGAQQIVALRERLATLAREAVDVTYQLFNVGQADRPDLLQAEVEAQQVQLDLITARNDLERSWRQLTAVIGDPNLQRRPLAGKLDDSIPELDWDKVLAALLEESPELKIAEIGVKRAEAALKRAQVEWIPDITLRCGVRYNFERFAPGDRVLGPEGFAEIRVPLPVFDRNQGNVASAQADLERARHEVERVELSLRRRLSATFADYLTSYQTVEVYGTRILADARQAYELYLQRFRQMAAAYPQVLITQRTLFQAQVAYVAALIDLWRAVVEIRGLLLVDGLAAPAAPGEIDKES